MSQFHHWFFYASEDPENLSPVAARQLRLMRYSQWILLVMATIFLLLALVQGVLPRIIGLGGSASLLVLSIFLVERRSLRLLGLHTFAASFTVGVVVGCVTNGGLGSVASFWLVTIPLLTAVAGGLPLAKPWIYVTFLLFLLLFGLDLAGLQVPNYTNPEFQFWQDRVQQLLQAVTVVMSIAGLIGQVTLSEQTLLANIDALGIEVNARVLAEQRVIAAQQKRDAFFTSMSHELRTPLNAITGFARMVKSQHSKHGAIDQRGLEGLDRILANGQDLLAILNDLLAFARNTNQSDLISLSRCDLHAQVADVVGDLQSLRSKSVVLINNCRGQMYLNTDPSLVRRILVNLIGNALKFTDSGEVVIDCKSVEREDGTFVSISVTDSGPGIDEKDQELIFEPYTRAIRSSTSSTGSGLGLALCQQWSHLLGGTIEMFSEPGKGSQFRLLLPVENKIAAGGN